MGNHGTDEGSIYRSFLRFSSHVAQVFWCRLQDSNLRPPHYECDALPAELKRPAGGAPLAVGPDPRKRLRDALPYLNHRRPMVIIAGGICAADGVGYVGWTRCGR